MKAGIDKLLQLPQAEYLDRILPPSEPLLERIEQYAVENRHPIADREVAQLMRVVLRLKQPKHLLEVGTNIGYSVIVMGRECPASTIETIELNSEILATAKRFVAEAGLKSTLRFHQGAALDVIPNLSGPFDFVFIDCVKTEYEDYLNELLPRLQPGALIMCDNLLWGGQVATQPRADDQKTSTEALRRFNDRLTTDSRLTTSILAVGDGVGLSVVR
ncbi:MAG TPA: O-methyltransferase [Thermoanaerobaculia bacterium]|nr:O-methyltransferase [Thermoanaerobaculia bacterium]